MLELTNDRPKGQERDANKNSLFHISKTMEKDAVKYPSISNNKWITLAVEILFICSMVVLVFILHNLKQF